MHFKHELAGAVVAAAGRPDGDLAPPGGHDARDPRGHTQSGMAHALFNVIVAADIEPAPTKNSKMNGSAIGPGPVVDTGRFVGVGAIRQVIGGLETLQWALEMHYSNA